MLIVDYEFVFYFFIYFNVYNCCFLEGFSLISSFVLFFGCLVKAFFEAHSVE